MSTNILIRGRELSNEPCSNYRKNIRTARASPQHAKSKADDTISYGTLRGRRSLEK